VAEFASKLKAALAHADCPSCPVFVATNCRAREQLDELRALIAPSELVLYSDTHDASASGPLIPSEGARLAVEQLVAARADVFVRSSRSAVSQFIEGERRHLGFEHTTTN
jgi:hypothetical protein